MPRPAKMYIIAIIATGITLLISSLMGGWNGTGEARYACYLALACLVSAWKVRLPGMRGGISVNFLFILVAIAKLSLQETLTLACVAALVQCTLKAKKRPQLLQVMFNVNAIVISTWVAYKVPQELFSNQRDLPVILAVAACLYFVLNTAFVSLVISLVEKKDFFATWHNCHLWTFPYYLAGAAIAALISSADAAVGWRLALLPLPLMYLIFVHYRVFLSRRREELDGHAQAA